MRNVWIMREGTNILGIYDNESAAREDARRYGPRAAWERVHVDSEPQVPAE
jgi:hypothetical protein